MGTVAELYAREGRVGDALAAVTDALREAEEVPLYKPWVMRLRADLLVRNGASAAEVEAAYREAIERARSQGNKLYELQATTRFARWLKSQHRAAEARPMLTEIYDWFAEGFDTRPLKEAKALLGELGG